jgi:pyruvate dehydrogenase E2 component (dihydrolipoamide acetyltransferase)
MVQSMYTAPHVTTVDEAEVSALVALRERLLPLAEAKGVRLTYLPFVIRAVTTVLRAFPYVNASLDDEKEEIVLHGDIHIGIATATQDGLMVPVVRHADRKSILRLAKEIRELTERARARTSTVEELRGSTFSITNIGSVGGLSATPIINYPEVAILGVYRIVDRPVIKEGAVVPGKVMGLTLTFDHRVIDGEMGARFLRQVAELLEDPDRLLLEMD